jgi:pimeloyl-ACP methyl ester carboxylesterase
MTRAGESSAGGTTPLDALDVIASQDVMVTAQLRHLEIYTLHGLLTVLWHEPSAPSGPGAVVMCGGAMGGLLGPAGGMYHHLGVELAEAGVPVIRVSYRRPNDLDACTLDAAASVQLLVGTGAERVVVMGHSFGGAVAVRVGAAFSGIVSGVVTFSTQSAGCEGAAGLQGRPFLLFHGERDEILPVLASETVVAMAGCGDLVVLPNDGHLLAKSGPAMHERLWEWLPSALGQPLPP